MSNEAENGHNSGVSGDRLRTIIKRIEKLEEDKTPSGRG